MHHAMVHAVDVAGKHRKLIAIGALAVILAAVGVYAGVRVFASRQATAQEQLGKGLSFFHADVRPDAVNDPYGKGPAPSFRSDADKYRAAAKEFSSVVSKVGYSSTAAVARYYLGLSQLRLGQTKEAIQSLEAAGNSSRNRPAGYLAKRALAGAYMASGNNRAAKDILEALVKDPQCDLPKEELSVQLARILDGMGKGGEAVKVLREAGAQSPEFGAYKQLLATEMEKLQKTSRAVPQQ